MRPAAGFFVAAFALAVGGPAMAEAARSRAKPTKPETASTRLRECARANYPGDPVCAWEDDGQNLPTPSPRAVRREMADDVLINEAMSVSGADPVAMAKPPVQSANPYPTKKKEPVGGGAAVNYKF